MTAIFRGMLTVCACVTAMGQTFEVASIRPSTPTADKVDVGVHIDGARISCTYLSLREYVRIASQLKDYQILGPDWLADRFDIAATLPAGATRAQVPAMMQALLAERFGMKAHRDTKEFPVYGLAIGKGGLKAKESSPDADTDSASTGRDAVNVSASGGRGGVAFNLGNGASFVFSNNQFVARKLTMTNLADSLARFLDRPAVDMTDVKGQYDLTLPLSAEDYRAMQIRSAVQAGVVLPPQALRLLEDGLGESLTSALDAAGLRLEPRKAPLDVLVVDHIERVPTGN